MDDIVLLSEVHPLAADPLQNPVRQAREWHGLLSDEDLDFIRRQSTFSWLQVIELIYCRAAERGDYLAIRDWSYIDFIGAPWVKQPLMELRATSVLSVSFGVDAMAIVRHPVDQWLSFQSLQLIRGRLSVRDFMRGYRRFAEKAAEFGFVRFEDFTAEPAKYSQRLCDRLALPFDPTFEEKWLSYEYVTGDVGVNAAGRASSDATIRSLTRREMTRELMREFMANPDFGPSLKLLGY